ncbi:MAG: DNA-binding protein [Paracoccus sp. (in: a-proteobacteria)]
MSKTAHQVKSELIAQGKSVPDWAKEYGFPVRSVRAVIYGHNKGLRGQSHRIAVALGMKARPE